MRQNNLLAPMRVGALRGPHTHDGTIIPDMVDIMWGTASITTVTGQGQDAVFVALEHYSTECVRIHAHPRPPASRLWNRSVKACGSTSTGSLRRG